MRGYQDLKVWQLGVEIAIDVYRPTDTFPNERHTDYRVNCDEHRRQSPQTSQKDTHAAPPEIYSVSGDPWIGRRIGNPTVDIA